MSKFEDQLFDDLMDRHGSELRADQRPRETTVARPVRTRRRLAVAGGAVLAAGALTVGIAGIGGAESAYAVTQNDDGTVTVRIADVAAIGPANERLRELGIHAKAVEMTTTCAPLDESRLYRGDDYALPEGDGDGGVRIGRDLPRGYTMLLAVSSEPDRRDGVSFRAPVRNPAPSCILDPAADPEQRSPAG